MQFVFILFGLLLMIASLSCLSWVMRWRNADSHVRPYILLYSINQIILIMVSGIILMASIVLVGGDWRITCPIVGLTLIFHCWKEYLNSESKAIYDIIRIYKSLKKSQSHQNEQEILRETTHTFLKGIGLGKYDIEQNLQDFDKELIEEEGSSNTFTTQIHNQYAGAKESIRKTIDFVLLPWAVFKGKSDELYGSKGGFLKSFPERARREKRRERLISILIGKERAKTW